MTDKTINQIWKSQDIASEINFERIYKLRSAADELTLIRDRQMKRIFTLPFVICYFGYMFYDSIMRYLDGGGNWTNLCGASIFLFFIVLSAGQIYLFYRWRKVEIYEDARNYLRLSARILRGHMAIGKKSHLIFLPVVLLVLAMVYSRVELPVFYVIVTSFVIAVGIASYMQPAYNRKLYNTYKPILDDIDSILKNMDEAV